MEEKRSSSRDFGDYEILSELGRGGMGVVYKAREKSLQRDVALKILPRSLAKDPGLVKRFLREARAGAQLSHPNIVPVFAVGEHERTYFIAMEYVQGESLAGRLQIRGALPVNEALRIACDVAEALSEAHRHGMVHRDIKPQNIMIDSRGQAKVVDFGLAQIAAASTLLTAEQAPAGTPAFMSPEQCKGERLDERSDLYSLGATLYTMLTTSHPFTSSNPMSIMYQITHEPFPDLDEALPDVLPGVHQVLRNTVAKNPDQRYASADALASDLEGLLNDINYDVAPQGTGDFNAVVGSSVDHAKNLLDQDLTSDLLGDTEPILTGTPRRRVPARNVIAFPALPVRRIAIGTVSVLILAGLVIALIRALGPSTAYSVPDKYPTIQAAIDAAPAGETVFIRAGVYTEHIEFKDGVKLIGAGRDKVTIRFDGRNNHVISAVDCKSGTIAALTIEHTGGYADQDRYNAIDLRDSTVEVRDCTVQRGSGHGISINNGDSCVVRNCLLQYNGYNGVMVSGPGADSIVQSNVCRDNSEDGINFRNGASGIVEENACTGNALTGIAVGGKGTSAMLLNNVCEDNGRTGITIHSGAQGTAEDNSCTANAWPGFSVAHKGTLATLRNNVCEDNGQQGILFHIGAQGTAEGNSCSGNGFAGITVRDLGTWATLLNNVCEDNGQDGIGIETGAQGTAEDNSCNGNAFAGIAVAGPDASATLLNNVCQDNSSGIWFRAGAQGTAEGNMCSANLIAGIWVWDADTSPTIDRNKCNDNQNGIIFQQGAGGLARGNTCDNNFQTGISVRDQGTSPQIQDNSCSENRRFGIFVTAEASPSLSGNNVSGNAVEDIRDER